MEKIYKSQVKLLLDVLPLVSKEKCFALHGGTAINLFIRNMPRLSVDIDLTYLPIEDWENSLRNINAALKRIGSEIEKSISGSNATLREESSKLNISTASASIKIEVNKIGRGTYSPPDIRILCDRAQEEYNAFCEIAVVPLGQLFGGKICAALDRQHPRDLFDVKHLLNNEGLTEEIKTGFIFCLLGAKRPISEMLAPHFIDQKSALEKQFLGMTEEKFSYKEYELTKAQLVEEITNMLDDYDRNFLLQFKNALPIWDKYSFAGFPSIKRKVELLLDLKENKSEKHSTLLKKLSNVLDQLNSKRKTKVSK